MTKEARRCHRGSAFDQGTTAGAAWEARSLGLLIMFLSCGSIPARTIGTLVAEPNFYPFVVRSFTEHCVCLLNGIEERVSLDFLKGIDGVVSTEKAAAVKHGVSLRSHFYAGQRLPPFEPDRDQDGRDEGERDDYPDERVPAH
jgi:hypothetical protein